MNSPHRNANTTCLIVDDHPGICQGMSLIMDFDESLEVVGYARCGEQALELLRALRPDVALMDATLMTSLDGFETIRRARDEQLATRIVMYTAHDGSEYVRRAFDSGACGYVTKMSSYETVLASLRVVADGGSFVDPSIAGELSAPL